jgi:hypothetical protein
MGLVREAVELGADLPDLGDTISSLLPRMLENWFMNVRLMCMSSRRVPENGILALSTWPSSIPRRS